MKRIASAAIMLVLFATALAWAVRAQEKEEPLDPKILAFDKGPIKIDVSKYPPEFKATYKLVITKCGKCHTVARAINCDYALADEWERYIKRMMRRAGDYISADEGKQLYNFLVYDSKTRKKELFDKKTQQ
jgi:hypothetical protein